MESLFGWFGTVVLLSDCLSLCLSLGDTFQGVHTQSVNLVFLMQYFEH